MAWCRQATSHYLSQCWPRSISAYGVTRQQWVNSLWPSKTKMASMNMVYSGSGNGLPSAQCQAITWTNTNLSTRCLQNVSHFCLGIKVLISGSQNGDICWWEKKVGSHANIKMKPYWYTNSHNKVKTVSQSYLHNGNTYTWKDGLYIEKGPRVQGWTC